MRLHNTVASFALAGLLLYVVVNGRADNLVALLVEDGPDLARAIAAALILTFIARQLPGEWGDMMESILALAAISTALVKTPAIAREINRLFGVK